MGGFQLSARLVVAWALSLLVVFASMVSVINLWHGIKYQLTARHEISALDEFAHHLRHLGKTSTAVFTPAVDVHGAANCTGGTPSGAAFPWCHEIDFYTLGANGARYFQAFIYENGGVQQYTYTDPQIYKGTAPLGVAAVGSPIGVSYFRARPIPLTTYGTDPGANPIALAVYQRNNLQSAVRDDVIQTAFSGVTITNRIFHVETGNPYWLTSFDVLVGAEPTVGLTIDNGNATPTPPPGENITDQVVFPYPGAAVALNASQLAGGNGNGTVAPDLTVAEAHYHDYYVAKWTAGSCASARWTSPNPNAGSPYSGTYTSGHPAPPTPPAGAHYAYPVPNNDAMTTGAASFVLNSLSGAAGGLCDASVTDVYGQAAPTVVQVMAALQANPGSLQWVDPNNTLAKTVVVGKLWDQFALNSHKTNPDHLTSGCAGMYTVTGPTGSSAPNTPSGTVASQETWTVTPVLDSNGKDVGGSCDFVVASRYYGGGAPDPASPVEYVDIPVNGVGSFQQIPGGIQMPVSGQSINGCPVNFGQAFVNSDMTGGQILPGSQYAAQLNITRADGCFRPQVSVTQTDFTPTIDPPGTFALPNGGNENTCQSTLGLLYSGWAPNNTGPGPSNLFIQPGSKSGTCTVNIKGSVATGGVTVVDVVNPAAYMLRDGYISGGTVGDLNDALATLAAKASRNDQCTDPQSNATCATGICVAGVDCNNVLKLDTSSVPDNDIVGYIVYTHTIYTAPNCNDGCVQFLPTVAFHGAYIQIGETEDATPQVIGHYHYPYNASTDLPPSWCSNHQGSAGSKPCDEFVTYKIPGVNYPAPPPQGTFP